MKNSIKILTGHGAKFRWNYPFENGTPIVVTYSFAQGRTSYNDDGVTGFRKWTANHKWPATTALDEWERASGITFVEVPDFEIGDIRFGMIDLSGEKNAVGRQLSGKANYPWKTYDYKEDLIISSRASVAGDIFMNAKMYANQASEFRPGERGFSILLHEIGHAIGLKHPFEGNPRIPYPQADEDVSTMSYLRPYDFRKITELDKKAVEFLYGKNWKSLDAKWVENKDVLKISGSSRADKIIGTHLDDIVIGRKGADVVFTIAGHDRVLAGAGADEINLGSGDDVAKSGKGNDQIHGGRGNDTLDAGKGIDTVDGGRGDDEIDGGKGDDRLTGDVGDDVFKFSKGDGYDVIRDFRPSSDKIHIVKGSRNFEKLDIEQNGKHVLVDYGNDGDTIKLLRTNSEELSAVDFLFA